MNKALVAQEAYQGTSGGAIHPMEGLTVRDNIDRQIGRLKFQLNQLEESKSNLGPLLDMKISDIQRAMNY
jgi:hypothetical protein